MQFELNKQSVLKRLHLCHEILQGREIDKQQTLYVIRRAEKRLNTLRDLVAGEKVSKAKELYFSIRQAELFLEDEAKKVRATTDPVKKLAGYLELRDVVNGIRSATKLRKQDNANTVLNRFANEIDQQVALLEKERIGEVLQAVKGNKPIEYKTYQNSIIAVSDEINRITEAEKQRRKKIDDDMAEERAEVARKFKELNDLKNNAISNGDQATADEYSKQASSLLSTLSKKQSELFGNPEYSDKLDALNEQKKAIGEAIINDIKQASTITEQDAEKWVNEKLTITTRIKKKVLSNGMTEQEFIEDLKQFYILTNGRLGRLVIDYKNIKRAYAENVESYFSEGVVMLDADFKQEILFHELAHHLESDLFMRKMAGQYVKSRSIDGGKRYYLKDLTGNKSYGKKEIAYKTTFPNAYTGKIYSNGTTELLAMSAQYLYDPIKLVDMVSQDPDQIEFFTALMAQPKTELTEASKTLKDEILDTQENIENATSENSDKIIEQLASKVTWSSGSGLSFNDFSKMDQDILKNFIISDYPVANVTLPTGRTFSLYEAEKVRYASYLRGAGQKGYIALDLTGLKRDIAIDDFNDNQSYFSYFTRLNFTTAFPIQTRNKDLTKVLLLALTLMGEQSLMYKHTKGIVGEGFLGHGVIDQLAKIYL